MRYGNDMLAIAGASAALFGLSAADPISCWKNNDRGVLPINNAVGPNLMWSLRERYCNDYWSQSQTKLQTYRSSALTCEPADYSYWPPDSPLNGYCYGGYIMSFRSDSQQRCWHRLYSLINKCVGTNSNFNWDTNSGSWTTGTFYTEGGYYNDGNAYRTSARRAVADAEDTEHVPTIEHAEKIENRKRAAATNEDFRVITLGTDLATLFDITYHPNGTETDNLSKRAVEFLA